MDLGYRIFDLAVPLTLTLPADLLFRIARFPILVNVEGKVEFCQTSSSPLGVDAYYFSQSLPYRFVQRSLCRSAVPVPIFPNVRRISLSPPYCPSWGLITRLGLPESPDFIRSALIFSFRLQRLPVIPWHRGRILSPSLSVYPLMMTAFFFFFLHLSSSPISAAVSSIMEVVSTSLPARLGPLFLAPSPIVTSPPPFEI